MGQQYALEFKESIVKRMLSPQNEYISTLSRETWIPVDTRKWIGLSRQFLDLF